MGEPGLLRNPVHRDRNAMLHPTTRHLDESGLRRMDGIGSRPDTLQRIAELPSTRGHIVGFIADANLIIERPANEILTHAWPMIVHRKPVRAQGDRHLRGHPRRFAGVKGVVDEFLDQHNPPVSGLGPELHREFFVTEIFKRPLRFKEFPLK
jgi:hypothetical protein